MNTNYNKQCEKKLSIEIHLNKNMLLLLQNTFRQTKRTIADKTKGFTAYYILMNRNNIQVRHCLMVVAYVMFATIML